MKKIINCLLASVALFIIVACGGKSYNPETCEALEKKIDSKETLTQKDYSEMIDQLGGMLKIFGEKKKSIGDDKEKMEEWVKSEEGEKVTKYTYGFILYLGFNEDKLDNSNKKKLQSLSEDIKDLK